MLFQQEAHPTSVPGGLIVHSLKVIVPIHAVKSGSTSGNTS